MTTTLTDSQVNGLLRLADVLIPDQEGIDGAASVLADGAWLRRAFDASPHLHALVLEVLAEDVSDPEAVLTKWRRESPEACDAVAHVLAGAYFMVPQVRRSLGYPGQVKSPAKVEEAINDLDGDILDPVLERGPIYRPTPG